MSELMTQQQIRILLGQVFALVQRCPAGRVTTYGWIGKALGYSRGARMIGWIMNEASSGVPAQRVISSKGELTGSWAFGSPERMHQLLEAEGITFLADDHVDLKRYGWDPSQELKSAELQQILQQASTTFEPSPRLLLQLQRDPASPLDKSPMVSQKTEQDDDLNQLSLFS